MTKRIHVMGVNAPKPLRFSSREIESESIISVLCNFEPTIRGSALSLYF